jgi:hypothetical protein
MADIKLETDENGNLTLKPVVGWTTGTLSEKSVLLAIQYIERPEDYETGRKLIQFALTHQQSLELATALNKKARFVLEIQANRGKSQS